MPNVPSKLWQAYNFFSSSCADTYNLRFVEKSVLQTHFVLFFGNQKNLLFLINRFGEKNVLTKKRLNHFQQLGPSGPSWSISCDALVYIYLYVPFPCNFFRMAEAVSEIRFLKDIRTLKRSIIWNLLLSNFTLDGHQNSEEVHSLKSPFV